METSSEHPLTPEAVLDAIQAFIHATSADLGKQVEHIELMRLHPSLFSPASVAGLERALVTNTAANVAALNTFCASAQPNLRIVHENLASPAEVLTFLDFDRNLKAYSAGIITHEEQHIVWPIIATNELQIAP